MCVALADLRIQTAKIGSLVDVQESEDPEGLRVFYYLVQDLRVSISWGDQEYAANFFHSKVLDLFAHLSPLQD